jgi:peptidoglycan/LPS O-acetylase OafA/YrhL
MGDAAPREVKGELPWLDWIRFLAAFEVLLYHTRPWVFALYPKLPPEDRTVIVNMWFGATHFGREAVLVFFVLSGFLVGGNLIERAAAGTFRPLDYSIDRATRLMLPLVPALAYGAAVEYLRFGTFDPLLFAGNVAFLQGLAVEVPPYNNVVWSLNYEAWFYVLGGALAIVMANKAFRPWPSAAIIACLIVFSVLDAGLLFCWVIGALAARYTARSNRLLAAGIVLTAAGLFLSNEVFASVRAVTVGPGGWRSGQIIASAGMALVIQQLVLLRPRGALASRINTTGTALAAFSYSLYLTHWPTLSLLSYLGFRTGQGVNAESVTAYFTEAGVALIVAYAFYWAFERHTNSVRRAIKRRLSRSDELAPSGVGLVQ